MLERLSWRQLFGACLLGSLHPIGEQMNPMMGVYSIRLLYLISSNTFVDTVKDFCLCVILYMADKVCLELKQIGVPRSKTLILAIHMYSFHLGWNYLFRLKELWVLPYTSIELFLFFVWISALLFPVRTGVVVAWRFFLLQLVFALINFCTSLLKYGTLSGIEHCFSNACFLMDLMMTTLNWLCSTKGTGSHDSHSLYNGSPMKSHDICIIIYMLVMRSFKGWKTNMSLVIIWHFMFYSSILCKFIVSELTNGA